jgi:hypothetical protein
MTPDLADALPRQGQTNAAESSEGAVLETLAKLMLRSRLYFCGLDNAAAVGITLPRVVAFSTPSGRDKTA